MQNNATDQRNIFERARNEIDARRERMAVGSFSYSRSTENHARKQLREAVKVLCALLDNDTVHNRQQVRDRLGRIWIDVVDCHSLREAIDTARELCRKK